jgi:hypothetical protein
VARKRSVVPSAADPLVARWREEIAAIKNPATQYRRLAEPFQTAVVEAVKMRKAGTTTCSLMSFYRYLSQVGLPTGKGDERVKLSLSSSALRAFIQDVLGYSWPKSTGATGVQIAPVSRRP